MSPSATACANTCPVVSTTALIVAGREPLVGEVSDERASVHRAHRRDPHLPEVRRRVVADSSLDIDSCARADAGFRREPFVGVAGEPDESERGVEPFAGVEAMFVRRSETVARLLSCEGFRVFPAVVTGVSGLPAQRPVLPAISDMSHAYPSVSS